MTGTTLRQNRALREIVESMRITNYGRHWPSEYQHFYSLWGYFNRIYDSLYTDNCEWQKIARFAMDGQFTAISSQVLQNPVVKELSKQACVGDGKSSYAPTDHVRVSFRTLRLHFQIDGNQVCQQHWKCQERHNQGMPLCSVYPWGNTTRNTTSPEYAKYTPFGSLLLIIYQIRNNLFHGAKLEASGSDYDRNMLLVRLSSQIMAEILAEFSQLV